MIGVALFVLVILALASWSLQARGYLGTAVAVVGGLALLGGSLRVLLRARLRRRRKLAIHPQRHSEQEGKQPSQYWPEEEEVRPEYEERPVRSEPPGGTAQEQHPRAPLKRDEPPRRLDEMSDEELERLVAHHLRRQGCAFEATPAPGYRGADLVIVADEQRRITVRIKRGEEGPVGYGAVREALGGRAFYGAYEAWLITDGTFAKGIRREAKMAGVRLIDGEELAGWLGELAVLLLDRAGDETR